MSVSRAQIRAAEAYCKRQRGNVNVKKINRERKKTDTKSKVFPSDGFQTTDFALNRSFNSRKQSLYRPWSPSDYLSQTSTSDGDDDSDSEKTREEPSKVLYCRMCAHLKIPPAKIFFRNLTKNQISVSYRILGPEGAKACAAALSENAHVETFDMTGNEIGNRGARYMAEMLHENVYLTSLILAENGISGEGLNLLSQVLPLNKTLKSFDISGNDLTEKDSTAIAHIIKFSTTLKELKVSHNVFAEKGGIELGPAIADSESVQHLDLSWNHLRLKGAIAVADGIKKSVTLLSVNISWNGFYLPGSRALCRMLEENEVLQELDISSNRLNRECIEVICNGLKKNKTLKVLKINSNPMTGDGAIHLIQTIQNNPQIAIRELDLSGQTVDKLFLNTVIEAEKARGELIVRHGVVFGHTDTSQEATEFVNDDPMMVLMEYTRQMNMRLVDLFTSLDADGSASLTRQEFRDGLLSVNIPLSSRCLDRLINKLDMDGDGEVDFSELMVGQKDHRRKIAQIQSDPDGSGNDELRKIAEKITKLLEQRKKIWSMEREKAKRRKEEEKLKKIANMTMMANVLKKGKSKSKKCSMYMIGNCNTKRASNFVKKSLYIGVLSTANFLDTRAKACQKTWGSTKGATVKFYAQSDHHDESIVKLSSDIDDSVYPPQKKSFRMLQHMCRLSDSYEWFMRADDDSYIKIEQLIKFLNGIDSNQLHYIGQAGFGRMDEKLGLGTSIYCMGGPGVIFSSVLLQKVCPHIESCLGNITSKHEDTEIGRCINRHIGINCTSAYDLRQLFYFHYAERSGSFSGPLDGLVASIMKNAITLHPIKRKEYFYRFHFRLLGIKAIDLRAKIQKLKTNFKNTKTSKQSVNTWFSLEYNTIVTHQQIVPKKRLPEPWRAFFKNIYGNIFVNLKTELLNLTVDISKFNDKQTKAYYTYNPISGITCHFALHFESRNKLNRKRRLLVEQKFTLPEIRIIENKPTTKNKTRNHFIWPVFSPSTLQSKKPNRYIQLVISLSNRYSTFKRFIECLSRVVFPSKKFHANLFVALAANNTEDTNEKIIELIKKTQNLFPNREIKYTIIDKPFSRGYFLQKAADYFPDTTLLGVFDVDLVITEGVIRRLIDNTIAGKQVYFPIFFSHFNPNVTGNKSFENENIHDSQGTWRSTSYGVVGIYAGDLRKIGGFNIKINGWGTEDIDFAEKVIGHNLTVFRSIDKNMIHLYHPIRCLVNNAIQENMCTGIRSVISGSQNYLVSLLTDKRHKKIYNRSPLYIKKKKKRG
ncbi:DgyrCDS5000 [Dimorphilus gyrociliatus]|uniref:Hexosyltransferase n=1 Tax=Dimorphilus gyrociliatus TaxID=2664684 RepID=A0A7I8VID4_9ANNE|nr:DgyrCDS5000 [Dimorphilus gyrociliatus]